MNALKVLFIHSLRERTSHLTRNLLAGGIFLIIPVMRVFEHGQGGLPGANTALWLSLIYGAGLIGPDASSGVLELVLTRPVTRTQYVLARWLSAIALAGGAAVFQTMVVAAIMAAYGHAPGLAAVSAIVPQLAVAIALPAVLICFSAMTAGYGDLRIWVLLLVFGELVEMAGNMRHWAWLARVGKEIGGLMVPVMGQGALRDLLRFPWTPVIAWLSTVVLALAVAIAVLNRRELSHGGS